MIITSFMIIIELLHLHSLFLLHSFYIHAFVLILIVLYKCRLSIFVIFLLSLSDVT